MDRSTAINLIAETYAKNSYGQLVPTSSSRKVYAQIDSVSRSEFFEGGRNGLNPELMFRMLASDYRDERTVEYNGKKYGIYRTYLGRNDIIELYAERKGGLNPATTETVTTESASTEGGTNAQTEGSTP